MELSHGLILFSTAKGLPPMKTSSGEIASVSIWKRAVKDAAEKLGIDLDDPHAIIYKDDLEDFSDGEGQVDSPPRKRKRRRSTRKEYGDPIEALSAMCRDFLASISISSAEEFLETKTSEIAKKFAKYRKRAKLPKLKGTGEAATISAWKTTCRSLYEKTKTSSPKGTLKNPPQKRRKDGRSREFEEVIFQSPAKKNTALSRSERAKKRSADNGSVNSQKERKRRKVGRGRTAKVKMEAVENPLDVLSEPARAFLKQINIATAEEFIETPTRDIAEHFAEWRKKEGMLLWTIPVIFSFMLCVNSLSTRMISSHPPGLPALRGSGNGATISAWKTLCRNAVEQVEGDGDEEEIESDGAEEGSPEDEAQHEESAPEPVVSKPKRRTPKKESMVSEVEEVDENTRSTRRSSRRTRGRRV